MVERWHGPAVVLGREVRGEQLMDGYWLAHNGYLPLVAPEHIRSATREERLSSAVMSQVMTDMRSMLGDDRQNLRFYDLRQAAEEETIPEQNVAPEVVAAAMTPGSTATATVPPQQEPEAEMSGAGTPVRGDIAAEPTAQEEADLQPGGPETDGPNAVDMPVPDDDIEMPDTLILQNKATMKGNKGKELDAKYFDDDEWEKFRTADDKQWKAHIDTGAARIVPPAEAALVPRELILPVPSRFVRTNKSKDPREVEAKSRWVVPGHLAPKDDTRTDAPVAPQVALYLLFSLAANFDWPLGTFDVGDAFLTGKKNERKLYVRPPREGIRGVPNGSLIELVKGVFGLPESPRLWWLEMRDCILKAGFEELTFSPATFVFRDEPGGRITGQLVVHVDDGVWGGKGVKFRAAQAKLRKMINIKTERAGRFTILGRDVEQTEGGISVNQHDYVKKMKPVYVPAARRRQPETALLAQEQTAFASLVAQLAWPARTTMPALTFAVSDLQQRSKSATVSDLVRCNKVLRDAQEMVRRGVCLNFKRWPDANFDDFICGMVHDASFGNQPGEGSQQGYLTMVATPALLKGDAPVHLVDWGSSKIHRVVRSTLAAEGAAAAHAFDRGAQVRVILAELLHSRCAPWPQMMQLVPGAMATDCRSLRDHCLKTGGSVTEKRVAMDIADVRAGIDAGDQLKWIPTEWMAADGLTKHLVEQGPLDQIAMENHYSFTDPAGLREG